MKILLALDGSEAAFEAARFLARLPLPEPVHIDIVTVVNPPDVVISAQSELWYPQFIEHQEELARQTLETGREMLSELGANVTTRQLMGHVGHSIIHHATSELVDLVVVAAKGHSALERVLLGSVSDYVATHAKCSVLVVRPELNPTDGEAQENFQLDTITVAVDQREVSSAMVEHLCPYRFNDQHTLHVVTAAVKLEVFREDILASTIEEGARRRSEAKACADSAAERLSHCGTHVQSHAIEVEHVGEGLVEFVEKQKSQLVVMGDSERGLISRFLLGSTSRYVLRHVHCSVLIVRSGAAR